MPSPMGRRRQSHLDLPPRMHLKSGTYYHVTTSSPRKWTSLGKDPAAARVKWAEIENNKSLTCTVGDMIERYFDSEAFAEKADGTKRMYRSVASPITAFFGATDISLITPGMIAMYMDGLESKAQANMGKALISNAMGIAVRYGLINTNPTREIKRHKLAGRKRYVTDEEFNAIRDNANPVLQSAMSISYVTGARISDVLKIRLSDWTADGLVIRQKKTGAFQLFARTPELEQVIDEARKIPRRVRSLYLLCTNRGQQYSTSTIRDFWIAARDKAGVKDVRFHDIRGKSATEAMLDGQDYQSMLGHSTRAMSDKYLKIETPIKASPRKRVL